MIRLDIHAKSEGRKLLQVFKKKNAEFMANIQLPFSFFVVVTSCTDCVVIRSRSLSTNYSNRIGLCVIAYESFKKKITKETSIWVIRKVTFQTGLHEDGRN